MPVRKFDQFVEIADESAGDGDGLLQNIVTNLGMGSRKDLTDGLREFTKVDNERALDVGELLRGTGKFLGPEAESSGRELGCNNPGESG